ncbi:hypothetical protein FW778_12070 [Ginsengibacter hankyongi]|uniref:Uncharacterized protein n=1 Tax=Ginsengibacter hankyongi TaxID=2607284 RepID=A0A5J5IHF5_9BACT|nr:hypothetical protein [Ginsengibacter hankyongi]KAA9039544.1 hypothetical protein FW778_12070 [Ginsengibacter hankyongi]
MLQKLKDYHGWVFILAIFFVFAGCNRYYKAVITKVKANPDKSVDSLKNQNRYFILRTPSQAYFMRNIILSEDRKKITCTLDDIPIEHQDYLYKGKGNLRYKEPFVLNEVHMYIGNDSALNKGSYTLTLDQIQKIEVIEKDKKRTTNSYVIGALGYTIGAIAVVAIIVAATKSSCPFISAYSNNEFVLQGETYGGAIYPQLARDDYMPLRMTPTTNNMLQLKISNELQEQQYTDFADLEVVTHSENTKVLVDEKGNLFEITDPRPPVEAWTGNNKDALAPLLKKDDNSLLHFDDTLAIDATNFVVAKFNKPVGTQNGKLVLAIKNSYWLDYLYGEMAKSFGSYYNTYVKRQNRRPASELLQWSKDQKIPLEVSVKTKTGWQKVTDLTTIGPLATRDIVVPLDLKNVEDSSVEVRLSSGFMFWEIDYAAIDFSENNNFSVETISPFIATDETGKDILPELNKRDGIYLEQPVPGNCVTLEYKCLPQRPNTAQTYILHTKGYYTHVRDLKGSPKIAFLKKLKKPGGFPSYSLDMYKKFSATTLQALVKN